MVVVVRWWLRAHIVTDFGLDLAFAKPNKRSNKCPKCTVEVTFIQIEDVVELEVRI